ncbi:MAG: ArgE/DapE family deacylase, partial [Ostreibacterium sp.]
DIEEKILATCDLIFSEVIDFTKAMISHYAILDNEQSILDTVERQLVNLKLPVKRIGMQHDILCQSHLYAPVDWDHESKYNVISVLNETSSGKSLVLNGHLDVVPAEPSDMWTHAPNLSWEKDGWLYGRGAGDMQSGVAAMIYAVHVFERAGYEIKSPLTIQAVVEEECSGNGTLACVQQGYSGDFVLIPEPFGPKIYGGQIGVLWFKVNVRGKPVHVLDTSAGNDAIKNLLQLIPFLEKLECELNEKYRCSPYDKYPHPFNLNIGKINAGNWSSSVSADATFEGRIGFPPEIDVNTMMQMVSDQINQASLLIPALAGIKPTLRFHGFRSQGHIIDTTSKAINLLSDCHRALTQKDPEHYLATCTTDLRAFHFYSKTSGTCYGPIAKNIHGIDECVDIESIRHTLKTYALFISRYCKVVKR